MDPHLEIRKLPPSAVRQLSQILDYGSHWKDLMAIIPARLSRDTFEVNISERNPAKYNSEHIEIIEQGAIQLRKSPTSILIDEWGTSGRPRANLGILVHLLAKANLYRAADYVSVDLLEKQPVDRPKVGPASTVKLEVSDLLKIKADKLKRLPNTFPDLDYLMRRIDFIELRDMYESGELLQVQYRSLQPLLDNIEYPFSETVTSFYVDSDTESIIEENDFGIPSRQHFQNEGIEKNDFVKGKNKIRRFNKKILNIIKKFIPKKETSDLIQFSNGSRMYENWKKGRKSRRKKNLAGINIVNSEEAIAPVNLEKKTLTYSGHYSISGGHAVPDLSMLLDVPSDATHPKDYDMTASKYYENRHQQNTEIQRESKRTVEHCFCSNLPAFSKILTDPQFSKYKEKENWNFVELSVEVKTRRRNTM